jgi:anti-anti-sigma regulatory factor
LIIRLEGVFDLDAARHVLDAVAKAPADTEIYVDLGRVRDFHDHGLAVLAEALSGARSRVSVLGLRHHQYRMLRYLGVDPQALHAGLPPRNGPQPLRQMA